MVAFDGIAVGAALEAIARSGASHAEPAFIAGTMVFSEDDFSDAATRTLRRAIEGAGLGCLAMSGHMDAGVEDAAERLARRLRFAAGLGARFLITNTAQRPRREAFLRTVATVIPVAEQHGVALAFENPGHGPDDLLRQAGDAAALLAELHSPWVTFNYDVGNALTNSEGAVRPEVDMADALPLARHLHLKDMRAHDGVWSYTALGEGDLDYDTILAQVAAYPELPVCVELPLRQVRRQHASPVRADAAPALDTVREAVERSVRRVRAGLAGVGG